MYYMPMDKERSKRSESCESEEKTERDESGYSEKQTDLDIEIKAGEYQNLRRFKRFNQRSRQGKIIAMHQAVSNRLNQLTSLYYQLVGQSPKQGEKLLLELKKLRLMQDYLLQCLVWEERGELVKSNVPQEIWRMIE